MDGQPDFLFPIFRSHFLKDFEETIPAGFENILVSKMSGLINVYVCNLAFSMAYFLPAIQQEKSAPLVRFNAAAAAAAAFSGALALETCGEWPNFSQQEVNQP